MICNGMANASHTSICVPVYVDGDMRKDEQCEHMIFICTIKNYKL